LNCKNLPEPGFNQEKYRIRKKRVKLRNLDPAVFLTVSEGLDILAVPEMLLKA
jgi:hypothetical protein